MSKIEQLIEDNYHETNLAIMAKMELEQLEFQIYEDLIEVSINNPDEALNTLRGMSNLNQVYFVSKHINYTNYPQDLYKLILHSINYR